jgi:Xaa-Pro aminopeptidase
MNYAQRLQDLRISLTKKKLDAFLTSHLPNVRYLSGFSGSNALLIVTHTGSYFLTDFRYKEQIQTEVVAGVKITGLGSLVELASKKKIFSTVHSIGFESDHLSVEQFQQTGKFTRHKKLIPVRGIVEHLRSVKENEEIALLKKAVTITDAVFQKVLGIIKPGITESDIAAEISYVQRKLGAENDAFDTIVASGERSALPHGRASQKKIAYGEFVTLDFGCIVDGYHSDMTRTVCVGKPNSEMKSIYRIVLDAQQKALDAVAAGKKAKVIDAASRSHIASKGYGKYFGHSLGHGVGLEIHEPFRLSTTSKDVLRPGNVVTIEPGIYLPKKFGVRIEDMVVVRNEGHKILTSSPKEMIIL